MADIEKILDNLNLPKQILDKSEALLKALFGPSLDEFGGMIADNVKLRRFKNQVRIFSKAQEILEEKNIDPKKVSLKVLAPLIEYSSYEEKRLQDKCAKLTTHILTNNGDVVFQQNCINILNRLSSEEATLLDKLHIILDRQRNDRFARQKQFYQTTLTDDIISFKPESPEGYPLDSFTFSVVALSKEIDMLKQTLEFRISNLIALGLLRWEIGVDVSAEKSDDPEEKEIKVSVDVHNNDDFIFTPLGDKFVKICETK